jgi:predicted hydrocarbon binding protein
VSHYPDEEVTGIVAAIADRTGRTERAVEREFGESLVPELLDTFKAHVRDEWDTLDTLDELEAIYESIEQGSDDTSPPDVTTGRDGDTATVVYRSDRGLCAMAEGIVHGVAAAKGETVAVEQPVCVHDGDDRCELSVRRT